MATTPDPDICRWCGYTRPDHDEGCAVRKLAEGMARTMSSPTGTATEFNVEIGTTTSNDD